MKMLDHWFAIVALVFFLYIILEGSIKTSRKWRTTKYNEAKRKASFRGRD